ncbi:hypothetical protein PENTCL1PPCAC_8364, partial [Pristionchus entomophagus]
VLISLFLLSLCTAAPVQQADNNPCGNFRTYVNPTTNATTCYHAVSLYKTWTGAEEDCVQRGAHLVSIHDAQFDALIHQQYMGSFNQEGCH